MRASAVIVGAAVLAGCATSPAKLAEGDFHWTAAAYPSSWESTYRAFIEGFRTCGGIYPEGQIYQDSQEGKIDIYLPAGFGGRSQWVFGKIRVIPTSEGSSAQIGVLKEYDRRQKQGDILAEWGRGNYQNCI
ncbi:hypothetical protein P7L68_19420 [Tistrella mobilis]|uniref:hypothetical protein n=1 Tax=Tistrella mobilis TaxID=171437 RepID=UPI00355638A3